MSIGMRWTTQIVDFEIDGEPQEMTVVTDEVIEAQY